MHFLLLLLRLVLDWFVTPWSDGLKMAARADGRIEHHAPRSAWWDRWFGGAEFRARKGRTSAEGARRGWRCAIWESSQRLLGRS